MKCTAKVMKNNQSCKKGFNPRLNMQNFYLNRIVFPFFVLSLAASKIPTTISGSSICFYVASLITCSKTNASFSQQSSSLAMAKAARFFPFETKRLTEEAK